MKETFFAGCVWSVQDFHGQAAFNFEWRISFGKILFNSRHVADIVTYSGRCICQFYLFKGFLELHLKNRQ